MRRSSLKLPRFGAGIGLHRVKIAAARLAIPLDTFSRNSVVVTGSNGKGTVAKVLAEISWGCGTSTGLFTSPHIYEFNERFCIDGSPVSDAEIEETGSMVGEVIREHSQGASHDAFGEFEAWFLQALLIFSRAGVEFCVFEAGIGGRYDPTRLIKPHNSCIVSVDLEHTKLLGGTIREIALDKMDICPPNARIMMGRGLEAEKDALSTMAWLKDIDVCWFTDEVSGINWSPSGTKSEITIDWRDGERTTLLTGMLGSHSAANIALACVMYRRHFGVNHFYGSMASIKDRVNKVTWPGRFEVFRGDVDILIDMGHTPKAISGTVSDISTIFTDVPKVMLIGTSQTREYRGMLKSIAESADIFVLGRVFHGLEPEKIKEVILENNAGARILTFDNPEDAYHSAVTNAKNIDGMVCALGGLFWGAVIRALATNKDFRAIDFS